MEEAKVIGVPGNHPLLYIPQSIT
ncbi:uncharacterized protein G2W53_026637 [Senna tora]|uniref:Uncharacterized protein n=1 Tax=Senna tora TaxID=362788 RepID=A0A834WFU9_9FABA|nr:uncharacterized protein G2W53_026637 [Senna tora]